MEKQKGLVFGFGKKATAVRKTGQIDLDYPRFLIILAPPPRRHYHG